MVRKLPTPKEKLFRWRVARIEATPAVEIGTVEAPDAIGTVEAPESKWQFEHTASTIPNTKSGSWRGGLVECLLTAEQFFLVR